MVSDASSHAPNQPGPHTPSHPSASLSQSPPEHVVASSSSTTNSQSSPGPSSTTDTSHDPLSDIPVTIHRFHKLDPHELRLHTLSAHSHIISNYDDSAEMLALNSPRSDEAFFSERELEREKDSLDPPSTSTTPTLSAAAQRVVGMNGTRPPQDLMQSQAGSSFQVQSQTATEYEDPSQIDVMDVNDLNAENVFNDSQGSDDTMADFSSDGLDQELRRVKLYELIASVWTDRGTGFCQGYITNEPDPSDSILALELADPSGGSTSVENSDTVSAKLIVRSESQNYEILLSCFIRANDVYQRQDPTLIVWTEPDGTDLALSFQDPEGCSEVWDFIVDVQRHLCGKPGDSSFSSSSSPSAPLPTPTAQIVRSGRLPHPQIGIIAEIDGAIRMFSRSPVWKERICNFIQNQEYIKSMIEVFDVAEDIENLETLHALCTCMHTILQLNDHSIYEHVLQDELWLGVVGMMEYDPEFPNHKANFREFLTHASRFREPVTIPDPQVQRKVHYTYRLQYLKDVVLARSLDDSTFNVLNSCIIFNQVDIINHVQQDETFLRQIVALFDGSEDPASPKDKGKGKDKAIDDDRTQEMDVDKPEREGSSALNGQESLASIPTTVSISFSSSSSFPSSSKISFSSDTASGEPESQYITRRKEVVLMIQQLCSMGKNIQLPGRLALFRSLVDRDILLIVQWALMRPELQMISAAGEILVVLLDHDTIGVRTHILKQLQALNQNGSAETGDGFGNHIGSLPGSIATPSLPPLSIFTDPSRPKEPPKPKEPSRMPYKETLLHLLCRLLTCTHEMAVQSQIADSVRVLLEIPQGDPMDAHPGIGARLLSRAKEDPSTDRFIDSFYKSGIESLFKPILNDVPDHKILKNESLSLSRERANLYLYLCDLLCSFALQHSFRSHFFILSSNISSHVASLLSVRDKHLCLAALRFFRVCLKINNRNLFTHLFKQSVFSPIIAMTLRECRRNNLTSSTCQEFFDFMRKENLKQVIEEIMNKYGDQIRQLTGTAVGSSTYSALINRWEKNNEPPPKVEEQPLPQSGRRSGLSRILENEEDEYFNGDDDEEPFTIINRIPVMQTPPKKQRRIRLSLGGQKPSPAVGTPPQRAPNGVVRNISTLSSLLDYGEDDDAPGPNLAESSGVMYSSPLPEHGSPLADSPTVSPRQIQLLPAKPEPHSDEEDDLLESLVNQKSASASSSTLTQQGQTPSSSSLKYHFAGGTPSFPKGKRRRDDEDSDEDGELERLASRNKRVATSNSEDRPEAETAPTTTTTPKPDEGSGPKKLKMKFGAALRAMTGNARASLNGTKDGDGG